MRKPILIFFSLVLIVSSLMGQIIIRDPMTNPGSGDAGDLSLGTVIKMVETNTIDACGATESPVGIITSRYEQSSAPDQYLISASGITTVLISTTMPGGETIHHGDKVVTAANGRVTRIDLNPEGYIVGTALNYGGPGDELKILINIHTGGGGGDPDDIDVTMTGHDDFALFGEEVTNVHMALDVLDQEISDIYSGALTVGLNDAYLDGAEIAIDATNGPVIISVPSEVDGVNALEINQTDPASVGLMVSNGTGTAVEAVSSGTAIYSNGDFRMKSDAKIYSNLGFQFHLDDAGGGSVEYFQVMDEADAEIFRIQENRDVKVPHDGDFVIGFIGEDAWSMKTLAEVVGAQEHPTLGSIYHLPSGWTGHNMINPDSSLVWNIAVIDSAIGDPSTIMHGLQDGYDDGYQIETSGDPVTIKSPSSSLLDIGDTTTVLHVDGHQYIDGTLEVTGDIQTSENGLYMVNASGDSMHLSAPSLDADYEITFPNSDGTVLLDGGGGSLPTATTDGTVLHWDVDAPGGAAWVPNENAIISDDGSISIKDSGASTNYSTFASSALTAFRTYDLPDADGEISLLGQSITSDEIEDGTIASDDIGDDQVTLAKIASEGIDGQVLKMVSGSPAWAYEDPATDNQNLSLAGRDLSIERGTGVTFTGWDIDYSDDITSATTAGGDLAGTYPNPDVVALQGNAVSVTAPSANQVLKWNGLASQWQPQDDISGTDDQTLSYNPFNDEITIEDGNTIDITEVDTDDQDLSLAGTTLNITDGTGADLSGFMDNTDDQSISYDIATDVITLEDGGAIDISEVDTDDQNLSLSGTVLNITDGLGVDLSGVMVDTDDQTLSYNSTTDEITIEDGNTIDISEVDTDDQNLTLVGTTLNIDDGTGADLSSFMDNTDEQDLSLVGTTLNITDGSGVDLSGLMDNTDDQLLSYNAATDEITIEDGNTIDISEVDTDTDDQDLSLSGTNLNITDGTGADLSSFMDNTDDQNITGSSFNTVTNELTIGIESGTSQTIDLSDLDNPSTDDQNIQGSGLAGTVLTIGIEDGSNETVNLASLVNDADYVIGNEFQDLSSSRSGSNVTIAITDGTNATFTDQVNDADADATNEYNTNLNLSGTTLQLTDGGGTLSQDLSSLSDGTGTDDQNISGSGFNPVSNQLTIGIEDGSNETVDLSALDNSGTDDQNISGSGLSGTTLTIGIEDGTNETVNLASLVNDADAVIGNEFQDLSSSRSGSDVTIAITDGTNAIFTDNVNDADADATNEIQSLSISGHDITLSVGGGTVTVPDNVDDADHDASNEIQDIFASVTDGSNTYNAASSSDDIRFAGTGGASVAVNPTTGQVTIDASGVSSTVSTSAPITGNGSADSPITMAAATDAVSGYLTSTDHGNFQEAYGWGDHSMAGYLTSASLSVATQSEIEGNGSPTQPLGLADGPSGADKVYGWNGSTETWQLVDADFSGGSVGDNWGTQAVTSDATLTGDGAASASALSVNWGAANDLDASGNISDFGDADDLDSDGDLLPNVVGAAELADGTSSGQMWQWNGSAWVFVDGTALGEDNQNLTGASLSPANILQVNIEDGTSATVDLSALDDDTDADYIIGNEFQDLSSSRSGSNVTIAITDGTNAVFTDQVNDADFNPSNEFNTAVGLSGSTLQITDGGGTLTQDLSSLTDGTGTDDQNLTSATLSAGNILQVNIEDGSSASVDLSALDDDTDADYIIGNEYQDLSSSRSGSNVTIAITDGTNATFTDQVNDADFNPANEYNTGVSLSGTTLQITDGGGILSQDLSTLSDGTGTDDQNLTSATLSAGNILQVNIEDGSSASVDLSALDDDTDADYIIGNEYQDLSSSRSGSNVTIAITDGTNATFTDQVNDADFDPSNEYNTGVSLSGTTLQITDGGGTISQNLVSLRDGTGTDDQNLTSATLSAGNILQVNIEDGSSASVDLSALDNAGTDNQNISGSGLSGTTLTIGIENGSNETVNLSSLVNDADAVIGNEDVTGLSFNTSDGILSLTQDHGGTITTDLDGRYMTTGTMDADWQTGSGTVYNLSDNIGIGTSSPSAKLDVEGILSMSNYRIENVADPNSNDDAVNRGWVLANTSVTESNSGTVTAGNWYRIASNSGSRADAIFTLTDQISGGGHSTVTFKAGVNFGDRGGISVNVFNHSRYSTTTFSRIRILENGTYDGAYLEVYCARSGGVTYSMRDNLQSSGWAPVDWTGGSVPSGWTVNEFDIDKLAMVGDYTERFWVNRGGQVNVSNNLNMNSTQIVNLNCDGDLTDAATCGWVNANDDNTTYSAGNDIDFSGTTISVEDDIDASYMRSYYFVDRGGPDWGIGSTSGGSAVTTSGEDMAIYEPEDGNKIWAYFDDDQALYLTGTPDLIANGEIIANGSGNNYFAGNVGIGTTSPITKLDVVGTGRFTGQVTIPLTPSLNTNAASKGYVDSQVGSITESDPTWSGSANTSATIGRTGSVGIGTVSPVVKLDVNSGNSKAKTIEADGYIADVSGYLTRNMTSSHVWTVGSGSSGGFSQNGATSENAREWGVGPYGNRALLWKCGNDVGSDADGGWNFTGIPIDPNKAYRLTLWVRKTNSTNGTTYLGCNGSNTLNLSGSANTNPYFWSGDVPSLNKWYLMVGYIHANNDPSTTSYGGLYDGVTGAKVINFTDFKNGTATTQTHRAYLYYDTNTSDRQYFWDPRFEEVNGHEPSIEALLGGGAAVSGSGSNNYVAKFNASGNIQNSSLYDNGNVGIGTTSPSNKLDVVGWIETSSGILDGTDGVLNVNDDLYVESDYLYLNTTGEYLYSDATDLRFYSNSGYMDFRPHDGEHGLIIRDFDGSSTTWSGIRTQDDGAMELRADGSTYSQLQLQDDGDVIMNAGNVGIGTTTPAYKLVVQTGNAQINAHLGINTTPSTSYGIRNSSTTRPYYGASFYGTYYGVRSEDNGGGYGGYFRSSSSGGYGVYGYGYSRGVYGYSPSGDAVYGYTYNDNGAGTYGQAPGYMEIDRYWLGDTYWFTMGNAGMYGYGNEYFGSGGTYEEKGGCGGIGNGTCVGLYGTGAEDGVRGFAVMAARDSEIGLIFEDGVSTGTGVMGTGSAGSRFKGTQFGNISSGLGIGILAHSGMNISAYLTENSVAEGGYATLLGQDSTDAMIAYSTVMQDKNIIITGHAEFSDGLAEIEFDGQTVNNIKPDGNITVMITPNGFTDGQWAVTQKDENGFTARLRDGEDIEFDFMVIAQLKDEKPLPIDILQPEFREMINGAANFKVNIQEDDELEPKEASDDVHIKEMVKDKSSK